MKLKSLAAILLVLCMIFSVAGCARTIETTSEIFIEGEGTTTVIEGEDGYYEEGSGNLNKDPDNSNSDKNNTGADSQKGEADNNNGGTNNNSQQSNSSNNGSSNGGTDKNTSNNNGSTDNAPQNGNSGNNADNGNTGTNNQGNNSSTNGNAGNESNNQNNNSKDESTSTGKGLNGATVTLSTWAGSLEPAKTSPTYPDWKKKVDKIEEEYNCKLAFKHVVSFNEYVAALNSAHAAGIKYADITHVGSADIFPIAMRQGYYYALDDYIDLTDLAWDQNALKMTEYKGKHYLLFTNGVFNGNMMGIAFNRSVLDKFGQKYPSEYVKEGKWNTETFLNLAKACTGKIDGIDYYGFAQSKASVSIWGKIFGGEHIHKNGGKYTYNPDSKYIAGVQFCYDLIHTHKVTNDTKATFTDGNVAMTLSTCWFSDMKNSIPEKDAGWTYLPKGPDESEYYCDYDSVECWAIPTTVKNPDIIADIMADYVYPAKGTDYVADTLKSQFFDEESYNTAYAAAKIAQKTAVLTPRYDYITKTIGWNWHGIDKKQSPQAYFASVKAQAQACLDDVWDQK